jgi:hypothetical protein
MLYKSPLNVQLVIHVSDVQLRTPHSPWQRRHHSPTTERRYTVGSFYLPGIIALRLPMQCNPKFPMPKEFPLLLHDLSFKELGWWSLRPGTCYQ